MGELFLFDDLFPPLDPQGGKGGKNTAVKTGARPTRKKEERKEKKPSFRTDRKASFLFSDGKHLHILPEKNEEKREAFFEVYGTDLKAFVTEDGEEREITFPFFLWNRRKDLSDLSEKVFEIMCFY